jgi:Family of unknown function (DUF6152)
MKNKLVILLALGFLISLPLSAHHGSASFANGKTAVLKGTVTKWIYANPHLLLMLDVKSENGEVVHWVLETQSPTVMYPAGYRKDSFKPGDQVTVTAGLAKNGEPVGRIVNAVLADGTKLGDFRSESSTDR